MTDRELLELAAKAAGVVIESWTTYGPYAGGLEGCIWNPLADDGDALRLAVKLGLEVYMDPNGACEVVKRPEGGPAIANTEYCTNSYAATRRAIVRAAAEIGSRLK